MNKLVYLDANVLAYAARGGRYSFLIDRKLFFSFRIWTSRLLMP